MSDSPPERAMTIECLPVSYGDAILVTCWRDDTPPWRMLVDTGPSKTWPVVRDRLLRLPVDDHGMCHLDLFVVTHIDHDHIGAASELLRDGEISCGDTWFNGAPQLPPRRSRREGIGLGAMLDVSTLTSWNHAFGGAAIVTPRAGFVTAPVNGQSTPQITVLAPNRKAMTALARAWYKPPKAPQPKRSRDGERPPLAAAAQMATRRFVEDRSVPNRSSIVLLIEHRGASVLLMADSVPRIVRSALRRLAEHRGVELPLRVDALKMSHHASRSNTSIELLQSVDAEHFLVSTDGSRFGLPNDAALARVLAGGGRTVWFNHDNDVTRRWDGDSIWGGQGYEPRYPAAVDAGAVLHLNER